jgi:hypothetical protein
VPANLAKPAALADCFTRERPVPTARGAAPARTSQPAAPGSAPPGARRQAGALHRPPPPPSIAARRRFVASRLLRNRLRAPREAARRGIPKAEMFPTCSPRPHVVGEHVIRTSRSRANFVRVSDGIRTRDRRDHKPGVSLRSTRPTPVPSGSSGSLLSSTAAERRHRCCTHGAQRWSRRLSRLRRLHLTRR